MKRLNSTFFDTLHYRLPKGPSTEKLRSMALARDINLLYSGVSEFGISLDETTSEADLTDLLLLVAECIGADVPELNLQAPCQLPEQLKRTSGFMKQEVFHKYRSETEMMRYVKRLERKDMSLAHSMISLGSCTMKLNAASEMFAISWPEFAGLHPFAPLDQARGYHEMMVELRADLAEITGLADVSLQPNSGASGEYSGLMVIRAWHESRGEGHRDIA